MWDLRFAGAALKTKGTTLVLRLVRPSQGGLAGGGLSGSRTVSSAALRASGAVPTAKDASHAVSALDTPLAAAESSSVFLALPSLFSSLDIPCQPLGSFSSGLLCRLTGFANFTVVPFLRDLRPRVKGGGGKTAGSLLGVTVSLRPSWVHSWVHVRSTERGGGGKQRERPTGRTQRNKPNSPRFRILIGIPG